VVPFGSSRHVWGAAATGAAGWGGRATVRAGIATARGVGGQVMLAFFQI